MWRSHRSPRILFSDCERGHASAISLHGAGTSEHVSGEFLSDHAPLTQSHRGPSVGGVLGTTATQKISTYADFAGSEGCTSQCCRAFACRD